MFKMTGKRIFLICLILLVPTILAQVGEAVQDGDLSVDDAQALGRTLATEARDLKVKVKGQDVLDLEAQWMLGSVLGRVAYRIAHALKAD